VTANTLTGHSISARRGYTPMIMREFTERIPGSVTGRSNSKIVVDLDLFSLSPIRNYGSSSDNLTECSGITVCCGLYRVHRSIDNALGRIHWMSNSIRYTSTV
jgi:hypothetical protein